MNEAERVNEGAGPRGWDAVIEVYKRDIDRTLLRENLRLTPDERVRRLVAHLELVAELERAGRSRS